MELKIFDGHDHPGKLKRLCESSYMDPFERTWHTNNSRIRATNHVALAHAQSDEGTLIKCRYVTCMYVIKSHPVMYSDGMGALAEYFCIIISVREGAFIYIGIIQTVEKR